MDRPAVGDRDGFTHDRAEQPRRSYNTNIRLRSVNYHMEIGTIVKRYAIRLTITRQNSQVAWNPGRIGYDACVADVQLARKFDNHLAIDLELRAIGQCQVMEAVCSIRQSG